MNLEKIKINIEIVSELILDIEKLNAQVVNVANMNDLFYTTDERSNIIKTKLACIELKKLHIKKRMEI